ncbi:MAG: ferrochelatase, partial [Proteobacteria bacterium]
LNEFLTDPGVIQLPWLFRQILVRGIIVPRRAPESAKKYALIWTDQGSPLMVNAKALQEKLQKALESPVLLGMLYNQPSMESAFREAERLKADRIVLVPLYPQYAEATTGGTIKKARDVQAKLKQKIPLSVFEKFPTSEFFLKPLARLIEADRRENEHVLFTFHGLPESQVKQSTPECLRIENCCDRPPEQTKNCYRAQSFATARALARLMKLGSDEWSVSFQSRLGRAKWIGPYTDHTLEGFPARGIKKVLVTSPSFVSDCLETLEELGVEGKQSFLKAGGESYRLVPCVNAETDFAEGFAAALSQA